MLPPIFVEVQRFRQPWLWLLLAMTVVPTVGFMGWGMVSQLALGHPWGSKPMSDVGLALVGSFALLVSLTILLGLYAMRLVTEVTDVALIVRFVPLARRRIGYEDIEACEARKYSPLGEFGGWGVRWSPSRGWAFNVSGNDGVQLTLRGGARLLIGSQRADELAAAIRNAMADSQPGSSRA